MLDIVAEKNRLRRALRALTGGLRQLEYAADVCGALNICYPADAVRYIRRRELGDRYDGLPLCELETLMAQRTKSFVILCCYGMIKEAVRRQLEVLHSMQDAQHVPGSLEQTAQTRSA